MKRTLLTIGLVLGSSAGLLQAQQDSPYIFHTYSNAIQIPVLVLAPYQQAIPSSTVLHFAVSIDDGPEFPVTHVRLEGDDPITLAILLDLSGDQRHAVSSLDDAIADWATQTLHAVDSVSVYGVDCTAVRTADTMPPNGADLRRAVDAAIHSPAVHTLDKGYKDCDGWGDALSTITLQLAKLPGRRVILAVGNRARNSGDYSSKTGRQYTWKELTELADNNGVTVFGLEEGNVYSALSRGWENAFDSLCQKSGGMVFDMAQKGVGAELQRFTSALRGRYIVEFSRPENLAEGPHGFAVYTVHTSTNYSVRPAGISLPIADPAILADPSTLPSDPSLAPVVGNRRMLTPAH